MKKEYIENHVCSRFGCSRRCNGLSGAENSGILKEIMGIHMEKLFEIKLQYTERFAVELGTVEDLEKKISFLNQVVERLGSTDTGVIDLTDPQTARFRPQ